MPILLHAGWPTGNDPRVTRRAFARNHMATGALMWLTKPLWTGRQILSGFRGY